MIINKCCILICDDPADQAVFIQALNDVSPGTICIVASNAMDAIYMMTREQVIPDYVFIELSLPQMDGIEFLNIIKNDQDLKNIHVIVHATSPPPHKILEIKESGALAIYLRPYEYEGVCNMLYLCFSSDTAVYQQN